MTDHENTPAGAAVCAEHRVTYCHVCRWADGHAEGERAATQRIIAPAHELRLAGESLASWCSSQDNPPTVLLDLWQRAEDEWDALERGEHHE